ncbi:MAG: tetratricopeptide repeat protein [Spirochaetes bacterium]|nr:tetratricopeptide repeat protein [Spirochaetota bacterium]
MNISPVEKYLVQAKSYFDKGDFEKAIKNINKALFFEKDNERANYFKGLIYIKQRKYKESLEPLKIVSEKTKDFLIKNQVNLLIGYIYDYIGNTFKAIEYFQKVLKAGFESTQTYNALGALYYKAGEVKKAISYTKKALSINKNNFNAMNTLGYILVDSEINIDLGIKLIKRSLENDINNPARLDSMGWAYYKKGEYNLAYTFLKKAYDLMPDDPTINEHLQKLSKKLSLSR